MTRADAASSATASLPLPDTTQEAWRFTDLSRLRPRRLRLERPCGDSPRRQSRADDARHRRGRRRPWSARAASRSSARPTGSRSSRWPTHERLGTLVGADDKFTAHNAAQLEARPARPRAEGRRARAAALRADRELGRRTARSSGACSSIAEEGSRFTLIEEYASASPELARLLERRRRALRRAGREARVRLAAEPLARDVALRHAPRARRARRRARLGRRRLRLEEGQDPDPERPRRPGRDLARHRRLLRRRRRSISTTTRSRSTSRRTRRRDFAFKGALRDEATDGLARDDPRRAGRAEDERVPGEPQPAALAGRRTPTRSPASRSSPTTCAARTARRSARSTASSSST